MGVHVAFKGVGEIYCHAMFNSDTFNTGLLFLELSFVLGNAAKMEGRGQSHYFSRAGLLAMPPHTVPTGRRRSRHERCANNRIEVSALL